MFRARSFGAALASTLIVGRAKVADLEAHTSVSHGLAGDSVLCESGFESNVGEPDLLRSVESVTCMSVFSPVPKSLINGILQPPKSHWMMSATSSSSAGHGKRE